MRRTVRKILAATLLCANACASGCGTRNRVVYVPDGEPVRLRAAIKAAPVWVPGADGTEIPGEMDIPEGWYALPDPGK